MFREMNVIYLDYFYPNLRSAAASLTRFFQSFRGTTREELGGHIPADAEALLAAPPHQPGDTAALARRCHAGGAAAEGVCSPFLTARVRCSAVVINRLDYSSETTTDTQNPKGRPIKAS